MMWARCWSGLLGMTVLGWAPNAWAVPDPPTGLAITQPTAATRQTLTWIPPTSGSATRFQLWWSTTPGGPYATINIRSTATSYNHTGLTPGTRYYYRILAGDASGLSGPSVEVSGAPIGAPTTLQVSASSDPPITLSWTAPAGSPTSYDIKRSEVSGAEVSIGTSATTSYADTSALPGMRYFYVVSARKFGEGPNSGRVNKRLRPAAPTGVSVVGDRISAMLSWAASSGAVSYSVHRGTVSGAHPRNFGNVVSPFVDTWLVEGQRYYWVVRARNAAGVSVDSTEVSAVPGLPHCETASFLSVLPAGLPATSGTTVHPLGELTIDVASTCSSGTPEYRIQEQNYVTGEYSFLNGGAWQTSPVFLWGGGKVEGDTSRLFLEVRGRGGANPNYSEAPVPTTVRTFSTFPPGECESVSLEFSEPSPGLAGVPVLLTASSECSTGTPEYQFLAHDYLTGNYVWLRSHWSTDPEFLWEPPSPDFSTWGVYANVRSKWGDLTEAAVLVPYEFAALPPSTCDVPSVSAVGINSPQPSGTTINFSTSPTACSRGPTEYQYEVYSGADVFPAETRPYSSDRNFRWDTTDYADDFYTIVVSVRTAGTNAAQNSATTYFELTAPAPPFCGSVEITSLRPGPIVQVGIPNGVPSPGMMAFFAQARCSGGVAEYKYNLEGDSGPILIRDYSPDPSATWFAGGLPVGEYRVEVRARAVGANYDQSGGIYSFNVAQDPPPPIPPPPSPPTIAAQATPILDRKRVAPAEYRLDSGHLASIPVQKFFHRRIGFTVDGPPELWGEASGWSTLELDTWGCSTDTGIIVQLKNPDESHYQTLFNDDGGPPNYQKESHLVVPTWFGQKWIDVWVFSNERATTGPNCTLYRSFDGGAWADVARLEEVGGTLVDVGPLKQGDWVEVKTRVGARGDVATDMVVFDLAGYSTGIDVTNTSELPPIAVTQGNGAMITAADAARAHRRNFALIGKSSNEDSTPGTPHNYDTELRVDVVRGPLNSSYASAGFPSVGGVGTPIPLDEGRYYFWLFAETSEPVGKHGGFNPDYDAEIYWADPIITGPIAYLWEGAGLKNPDPSQVRIPSRFRGNLNRNAFSMTARGPNGFSASTRTVALGAFGSESRLHRFVLEVDVTLPGEYWLEANRFSDDITFSDLWAAQRNTDATELKSATANMLYTELRLYDDQVDPFNALGPGKYRNAANLLAARGEINPLTRHVDQPIDRGPFQWDADIVTLNEVDEYNNLGRFRSEAERTSPLSWSIVFGIQESSILRASYGGLFMNEQIRAPGGAMFASIGSGDVDGCVNAPTFDLPTIPNYAQCHLGDGGTALTSYVSAIPGRASVARAESLDGALAVGRDSDRPIAVINWHLASDDKKVERMSQIGNLVDRIRALLAAQPEAFNRLQGSNRSDPFNDANRIIIQGDSNMQTHLAGEHYWVLERLRDEFGYAVDVAMAADGSVRNGVGMHNYDDQVLPSTCQLPWPAWAQGPLPIHPEEIDGFWDPSSRFYDCHNNMAAFTSQNSYGLRTVMSGALWREHPDFILNPATVPLWPFDEPDGTNHSFPWWSSSWRGKTSGGWAADERFDVIILVGRGWEMDDPVVGYAVMQDNVQRNPFSVVDGQNRVLGVEMYFGWPPGCYRGSVRVDDLLACETVNPQGYTVVRTKGEFGEGSVPDDEALPNYHPLHDAGNGVGRGRAALQTDHRPVGARLRVISNGLSDFEDR